MVESAPEKDGALEKAQLEHKQRQIEHAKRDAEQRHRDVDLQYHIKRIAVATGIAVMLLMVAILVWHLFYAPLVPPHNRFSWVVIALPIVSLTIITTALFFAAFRRSEDKTAEGGEWESARIGGMMAGGGGG